MNLLARYKALVDKLASDHVELATERAARSRARVDAYTASQERSAHGRDQEADAASIDYHAEVLRLEGDIQAAEVELQWVRDLLSLGHTHWPPSA